MAIGKQGQHGGLYVVTLSVIAGISIFHRDWLVMLKGETFFVEDYYDFYFLAYKITVVSAALIPLILGGRPLPIWLALILPSLVLRHVLFLWEVGPTNMWPPAFLLDVAANAILFVACLAGAFLRSQILRGKKR